MSDLDGLRLTRNERIVVVILSYIFCAPVIYKNGKALLQYVHQLSAEAREQSEEDRDRPGGREVRGRRAVQ